MFLWCLFSRVFLNRVKEEEKNLNLLHHIENRLNYLETLLHTFDNIFLGHTHTHQIIPASIVSGLKSTMDWREFE